MPRAAKKDNIIPLAADQVTNDAEDIYDTRLPYTVSVTVKGVCPILFHRWSNEAVEAKGKATKGSKAKKTDDIESYLWRNADGYICLPGEYLRQSVINAAKYRQDPRSPRKSAMDITKAAIVSLTELAPIYPQTWEPVEMTEADRDLPIGAADEPDFLDKRRVIVQRSAITRTRPAMNTGWQATIDLMCNLPEYIDETFLRQLLDDAGRLIGVADFRPSYGRFSVTGFKLMGN